VFCPIPKKADRNLGAKGKARQVHLRFFLPYNTNPQKKRTLYYKNDVVTETHLIENKHMAPTLSKCNLFEFRAAVRLQP